MTIVVKAANEVIVLIYFLLKINTVARIQTQRIRINNGFTRSLNAGTN